MQIANIISTIWANKLKFFSVFFLIFTALYALLVIIDFLPEAPTEVPTEATTEVINEAVSVATAPTVLESPVETVQVVETIDTDTVAATPDKPVSMYIERLDRTIDVLNPVSRSIADLDNALLSGAVRHPDSATPNIDGTVLIMAHSSYLPNVLNRNFQAFNGIQNLEWGDTITLTSNGAIYTYQVERVYEAKASEVTVPIKGDSKLLTLATCDSFGSTDDRHIVEAKQIKVEMI